MKNLLIVLMASFQVACQNSSAKTVENLASAADSKEISDPIVPNSVAYFASGCFWCVEAVFESVKGVAEAESGYSGGKIVNPSYELICTGKTRHAEAVKVYYDSNLVSYSTLLTVFFDSHDPSTLNQQGPDRGPQYRSMIFYQNDKEKGLAENYTTNALLKKEFSKITTEVVPYDIFYIAEEYHQDYERLNPNQGYVQSVSVPRLNRFKAKHPELLK
ncbi:MAG: peptide-methionine (S)-S-oxide reductase MsrA [Crocinitomicaceae bacterium]|jgi:peptide-methionine (S)-S-oxide reductase|nr:peptide-methionine (S)-S-oxide reductase MsrA [Crocinitomicaceae bacterium]MDG2463821.1 peptide-methionine (S)-S-oxide reductase MsrA [Crocinitomicaceae bacterium]